MLLEKFKFNTKDYRFLIVLIGSSLAATLIVIKLVFDDRVYTDNAYVQCEIIDVVSEVNGVVKDIFFQDNSYVSLGNSLIKIEDEMFKADLNNAKSKFRAAEIQFDLAKKNESINSLEISGGLIKSRASLDTATANKRSLALEVDENSILLGTYVLESEFLEKELDRFNQLYSKNLVSKVEYEKSKRNFDTSVARISSLKSKIESLKSLTEAEQFKVVQARNDYDVNSESNPISISKEKVESDLKGVDIEIARAEYEKAEISLKRTNILAKRSGYITNRNVSSGDYVDIGQPIASLISCKNEAWVEANFKETQIERIKNGQKAVIKFDVYPGKEFYGKVEGVSAASGSTFSVLPPENASGNFTKVVQRFPVKISLDSQYEQEIRMGMSSLVTVILE